MDFGHWVAPGCFGNPDWRLVPNVSISTTGMFQAVQATKVAFLGVEKHNLLEIVDIY